MPSTEKAIKELTWYLTTNPLYSDPERYDSFREGLEDALELVKENLKLKERIQQLESVHVFQDDQSIMSINVCCPFCQRETEHRFVRRMPPKIVHCKDCVHWDEWEGTEPRRGSCMVYHVLHDAEFYCAEGKTADDA